MTNEELAAQAAGTGKTMVTGVQAVIFNVWACLCSLWL